MNVNFNHVVTNLPFSNGTAENFVLSLQDVEKIMFTSHFREINKFITTF